MMNAFAKPNFKFGNRPTSKQHKSDGRHLDVKNCKRRSLSNGQTIPCAATRRDPAAAKRWHHCTPYAIPVQPFTSSSRKTSMSVSIYTASIPVFTQMLGGLQGVLGKAEAHVAAKKIDPNALLQARLYPDMFPLLRQVQVASDFAKSVSARLADVAVPQLEDKEQTFADLQARIVTVLAFLQGLDPARFESADTREIVTQAGTPKEKRFTGSSYLLNYGLPHFFFHTTTVYAILRHSGVEVGKKDYIGTY